MSQSGINFFMDQYSSFNYEAYWRIWMSFKDVNTVSISQSGANTGYSGQYVGNYPLTYDYRNISKSGTGAAYIQLLPSSGLWDDQITLIFLNRKYDSKNGILFNCLESGLLNGENVYKGFTLGYTDGSRPFFYFNGQNGPETYVAEFDLSSNHVLYFTRDGDNIILGKYDYFTQTNTNNTFTINSNYLFEPLSGFYLGWHSGNVFPRQFWNSGNSQIIDEFLWFNYPLYEFDIKMIASGFAADYVSRSTGSGIILTTGITGYSTGLISKTGVTGWSITGTGFLTNQYGISYTGYLSGQLTGTFFQTGVTGLTGLIQTPEFFIIPEGTVINSGFLDTFKQNYVTFLRDTDELDFDSISYDIINLGAPTYREEGVYDQIREQFKVFYSNNAMSFVNGVGQFSGIRTNSGTIYNPNYILDRDYLKTGAYIESNGFYDDTNNFWYNDISGTIKYVKDFVAISGNSTTISNYNFAGNSMAFLNGQRVYSGIDWVISANNLQFIYTTGITGDLCVINLNGLRQEETGNFAWKQTNTGFNPNYSMVFMNGQRQILNEDYLVSDLANMLSGSGIFDVASGSIFDNFNQNDLFFS